MQKHWEGVYTSKEIDTLGWYEIQPESSLRLIAQCNIDKNEPVWDVGSGASTLIDHLDGQIVLKSLDPQKEAPIRFQVFRLRPGDQFRNAQVENSLIIQVTE